MHSFSTISESRLMTCHHDIQTLFREVIKAADCTILCGHRTQAEQDHAYAIGTSKLKFPHSRHNAMPSTAVDVMPVPLDWNNKAQLLAFQVVVKEAAARLGIKIQWGQDLWGWDGDHWQLSR
jgi:peptidoglycan L-alanyl-D-glutamate endopeptidase CwlK